MLCFEVMAKVMTFCGGEAQKLTSFVRMGFNMKKRVWRCEGVKVWRESSPRFGHAGILLDLHRCSHPKLLVFSCRYSRVTDFYKINFATHQPHKQKLYYELKKLPSTYIPSNTWLILSLLDDFTVAFKISIIIFKVFLLCYIAFC